MNGIWILLYGGEMRWLYGVWMKWMEGDEENRYSCLSGKSLFWVEVTLASNSLKTDENSS